MSLFKSLYNNAILTTLSTRKFTHRACICAGEMLFPYACSQYMTETQKVAEHYVPERTLKFLELHFSPLLRQTSNI